MFVHISSVHFLSHIAAFRLADCLQFIKIDLPAVERLYTIVRTPDSV